jgi:diguanylate cyclase (GGDEF)-like protein/PAS domain S-box-containing protein
VLFGGYFLRPRGAFAQLGCVLVVYGIALLQVPSGSGYSGLTRWIFTAVSLTVVTSLTTWLVARGRSAEERTSRFFELSDDMLCTATADGYFEELNPAWTRVLGWSIEELRAHPFLEWVHPEDREQTVAESTRAFADSSTAEFENRYFAKDGSWRRLSWSSAISPETGLVYARATDVTRRRALEEERETLLRELDSLARTDALTGIPNRRWLDDELRREMSRATRRGFELCIAMVDLDHFKLFNDEHGHLEGDRMLRTAAGAWRSALRTTDFLARYGGEEFVVLLPDCGLDDARDVMARLCAATPVGLTSSVGIAAWVPGEPAAAFIGRADAALYEAKRGGRDQIVVAAPPSASASPPVVG